MRAKGRDDGFTPEGLYWTSKSGFEPTSVRNTATDCLLVTTVVSVAGFGKPSQEQQTPCVVANGSAKDTLLFNSPLLLPNMPLMRTV